MFSDSRKAAEALGWAPRYPDLDTIVRTAWEWHSRRRQTIARKRTKKSAKISAQS